MAMDFCLINPIVYLILLYFFLLSTKPISGVPVPRHYSSNDNEFLFYFYFTGDRGWTTNRVLMFNKSDMKKIMRILLCWGLKTILNNGPNSQRGKFNRKVDIWLSGSKQALV